MEDIITPVCERCDSDDASFNYSAYEYLCGACDRRHEHSEWLRLQEGRRNRSRALTLPNMLTALDAVPA